MQAQRKPHEKKLPLPSLGWADLFVCFVCCFLFMLFRIKALGWIFFAAVVRNVVSKQRSLEQTLGFSEGKAIIFLPGSPGPLEKITKETLCPPGAQADSKEIE